RTTHSSGKLWQISRQLMRSGVPTGDSASLIDSPSRILEAAGSRVSPGCQTFGRTRAGALLAPDLDAGAAAAGEVAVLEVDVLDGPLGAAVAVGEIDGARARVLAEVLRDRGPERATAAEGDLHVDHLDVVVEDDDHQLAELAHRAAD